MQKNTESQNTVTTSKDSLFAFWRFLTSIIVICVLAIADLNSTENIPTVVYLLLGSLNGVDAYRLYREINKSS